jgi:hypothetical protein
MWTPKALIFSVSILFMHSIFAQSDYSRFDLNAQMGLNVFNRKVGPVIGLQGELHLNHRWSLLYNYNLGALDTTYSYFHAPMSLFAVVPVTNFLARNSYTFQDFLGSFLVGALTVLIPEGVGYHYGLMPRLDASVYANPLGLHVLFPTNPNLDHRFAYNANAGLKLSYYTSFKLLAHCYAQVNYVGKLGFHPSMGMGIGYAFQRKEPKD